MPILDIQQDSPSIRIEFREERGGPVEETFIIDRSGRGEIDWARCRAEGRGPPADVPARARGGLSIVLPEK